MLLRVALAACLAVDHLFPLLPVPPGEANSSITNSVSGACSRLHAPASAQAAAGATSFAAREDLPPSIRRPGRDARPHRGALRTRQPH